jgi:hypothetical protein
MKSNSKKKTIHLDEQTVLNRGSLQTHIQQLPAESRKNR